MAACLLCFQQGVADFEDEVVGLSEGGGLGGPIDPFDNSNEEEEEEGRNSNSASYHSSRDEELSRSHHHQRGKAPLVVRRVASCRHTFCDECLAKEWISSSSSPSGPSRANISEKRCPQCLLRVRPSFVEEWTNRIYATPPTTIMMEKTDTTGCRARSSHAPFGLEPAAELTSPLPDEDGGEAPTRSPAEEASAAIRTTLFPEATALPKDPKGQTGSSTSRSSSKNGIGRPLYGVSKTIHHTHVLLSSRLGINSGAAAPPPPPIEGTTTYSYSWQQEEEEDREKRQQPRQEVDNGGVAGATGEEVEEVVEEEEDANISITDQIMGLRRKSSRNNATHPTEWKSTPKDEERENGGGGFQSSGSTTASYSAQKLRLGGTPTSSRGPPPLSSLKNTYNSTGINKKREDGQDTGEQPQKKSSSTSAGIGPTSHMIPGEDEPIVGNLGGGRGKGGAAVTTNLPNNSPPQHQQQHNQPSQGAIANCLRELPVLRYFIPYMVLLFYQAYSRFDGDLSFARVYIDQKVITAITGQTSTRLFSVEEDGLSPSTIITGWVWMDVASFLWRRLSWRVVRWFLLGILIVAAVLAAIVEEPVTRNSSSSSQQVKWKSSGQGGESRAKSFSPYHDDGAFLAEDFHEELAALKSLQEQLSSKYGVDIFGSSDKETAAAIEEKNKPVGSAPAVNIRESLFDQSRIIQRYGSDGLPLQGDSSRRGENGSGGGDNEDGGLVSATWQQLVDQLGIKQRFEKLTSSMKNGKEVRVKRSSGYGGIIAWEGEANMDTV